MVGYSLRFLQSPGSLTQRSLATKNMNNTKLPLWSMELSWFCGEVTTDPLPATLLATSPATSLDQNSTVNQLCDQLNSTHDGFKQS